MTVLKLALSACLILLFGVTYAEDMAIQGADITVTNEKFELWRDFLSQQKTFKKQKATGENVQQSMLEAVALAYILPEHYGALVSAAETRRLKQTVRDRHIRRQFQQHVLLPTVTISDQDIARAYAQQKQRFTRPPGVDILEIFLWAPKDFPELRERKAAQMEEIKAKVTDANSFRALAEQYSDATSAVSRGDVNVLFAERISQDLKDVLFTGQHGLRDVVATSRGYYLFYVLRFIPRRTGTLEEITPLLRKRLSAQKLQQVKSAVDKQLENKYAIQFLDLTKTAGDQTAYTFGERVVTLAECCPRYGKMDNQALTQAVHRAALTRAYEKELPAEALKTVEAESSMEFAYTLSRMIFDRLLEQELSASGCGQIRKQIAREMTFQPQALRWTFDLLIVKGREDPSMLDRLFRLRQQADASGLEGMCRALNGREIACDIVTYTDVPVAKAASLGPEIHRTLKKYLAPGELSKPMYVPDRQWYVIVHFKARDRDEETSQALRDRMAGQKARQTCAEILLKRLLKRHEIVFPVQ